MSVKVMSLEEKYRRLLDQYLLYQITNYALVKELGATERYYNLLVKVNKKMLPSYLPVAFKVIKTVAPSKAFKQLVDDFMYAAQMSLPLSNIELNKISDREALIRVNNCPALERMKELVKKTGLDVNPVELCSLEARMFRELAKDLGVDLATQVEKNGCSLTAHLI